MERANDGVLGRVRSSLGDEPQTLKKCRVRLTPCFFLQVHQLHSDGVEGIVFTLKLKKVFTHLLDVLE